MTITAPARPPLVVVPDVAILAVGENWHLSTGDTTFTPDDLASAVAAQDDPAVRAPILKLGHTDKRAGFDGQPAFGKLINLRTADNGMTLVADVAGVPAWLAEIWPTAYPSRSIEGYWDMTTATGRSHPFTVTALALLGEVAPGIETLADLPLAFGIAAGVGSLEGLDPSTLAYGMVAAETSSNAPGSRHFAGQRTAAGATPTHTTATTDAAWNAATAWVNLPNEGNGTYYRDACAWYDGTAGDTDGDGLPDTKAAWRFIHHQVNADGSIGAANVNACAGAIAVLNGGRGVDPEAAPWTDDRQAIYDHMSAHLGHAGRNSADIPVLASQGETMTEPAEGGHPPRPAVASVSYEDVRRAYYDTQGNLMNAGWIRELVIDPPELIVDDDEGGLWRVPYATSGTTVTFGPAAEVRVEYVDVAAAASRASRDGVQIFASRHESREGVTAMDLTTLRQRLGAPATMTDEEVLSLATQRLDEIGTTSGAPAGEAESAPPPTAPAPVPPVPSPSSTTPIPAAGTGSASGTPSAPAPVVAPAEPVVETMVAPVRVPAMASLPPGTVLIDEATLAEIRANAAAGARVAAETLTARRHAFNDGVIHAGRMSPANVELRRHLEATWDANPLAAQTVASNLAIAFPVAEIGHSTAMEVTGVVGDGSDVALFPELAEIRGTTNGQGRI